MKPLQEVENHYKSLKPSVSAAFIARYVGSQNHEKRKPNEQSQLLFLGLTVPQNREATLNKWSFHQLPVQQQLQVWVYIYKGSKIYDVKSWALRELENYQKSLFKKAKAKKPTVSATELSKSLDVLFKIYENFLPYTDNWAHSDQISSLLAQILETNHKKYWSVYVKWNVSTAPWVQRQSLVGIHNYARLRSKHIKAPQVLKLIKTHLKNPHYFVQKAVGWTLREVYQYDPVAQKNFVKSVIQDISGTAWYATSEKYTPTEKKQFLALRSSFRQKKQKSSLKSTEPKKKSRSKS